MIEAPRNRQADDRARSRFIVISAVRISGVAFVVIALLILGDSLALPRPLAWVLLAVGLVDALIAPQLLARAWRSPRP
ncbi:MAG: hypothetical protein AB7G24_06360 [Novosphingobium sp.]